MCSRSVREQVISRPRLEPRSPTPASSMLFLDFVLQLLEQPCSQELRGMQDLTKQPFLPQQLSCPPQTSERSLLHLPFQYLRVPLQGWAFLSLSRSLSLSHTHTT